MAKVNYDKFASFDLNEACDHFDCTDQKAWKKIGKFIVADDYLTEFEKDQLEYEGQIRFPAKELVW